MKSLLFSILLLGSLQAGAQENSTGKGELKILLIGDAGELKNDRHPVLERVRELARQAGRKADYLFFLGDNIYPVGLPPLNDKTFPAKKSILDSQWQNGLLAAEKLVFIPGNHDWAKGKTAGWEQVKRQAAYLAGTGEPGIVFQPEDGCPGPVEIPVNDQVTAIVMDSQWWLQQEARPGITSDCDCKTEEEVLFRLKDLLYRNRHKMVLFLAHHPFRSDGIHGGYYQFKQHLFPLTDLRPHLWVPLPVLGSLYPLIRGGFGNIQDLKHPRYQNMASQVDSVLNTHPYCIRVAGHEHGLQYITAAGQHYIVSGSGSKSTRLRKRSQTVFNSPQEGFAVLSVSADGQVTLEFSGLNGQQPTLFRTTLPSLRSTTDTARISPRPAFPDSVTVVTAPYFRAGRFKEWLLGANYRQEWISPITVPVLDITRYAGGLTPTRRGGGQQSKSLRLEDPAGREYVLRSIEKYPDKTLPEELRQTFVKDAVADGISASYPFAALSIPGFATAAGVPHLKPRLVYLPDDPALLQYRKDFANELYLLENRAPEGVSKTYSTDKVLESLRKDNDNKVDQEAVLKARMLDMFIMDFDRHDDQWRWKAAEKGEGKTYQPVPRDRDQPFFINEGVLPGIISRPWLLPKFQGFRAKARNISGFNFNARYFDRSFLNEPSLAQWEAASRQLLVAMTDSVIDQSLAQQPAGIRPYHAREIAATLKKRREFFTADVLEYYRFLSRSIDIAGSDKREWFELDWKKDGSMGVKVYKISKSGRLEDLLYAREIRPEETREIRLYGLEGDDVFSLKGEGGGRTARQPGLVRIIGGGGSDTVLAQQRYVPGNRVKWYDLVTEKNHLSGNSPVQMKFSRNKLVNHYERKNFRYNITAPLLSFAYNRDDGIFVGAGFKSTRHGFRKDPYRWQQSLIGKYAAATGAYQFRYQLETPGFQFLANVKAPNNTRNFFGLGNNSDFPDYGNRKIRYFRSRYNLFELAAFYKIKVLGKLQLSTGPVFQHYRLDEEDNEGKFILQPESGLDREKITQAKTYLGWQVQAITDTRNNVIMPSRGFYWNNLFRWVNGQSRHAYSFNQVQTDLSFYISTSTRAELVLAGRIGAGHNNGNFEFFQAQRLGGSENLRGYRNDRFAGNSMVFNNIDLRLKLAEIRGYILPGTIGLLMFNDIGRVWQLGESSARWHHGYGAGVWFAPAGRVVFTGNLAYSKEGILPMVTLGFQF